MVIGVSVVGVWGVMMFRKRLLEDEQMTGGSPFSISELKRLREEGLLTPAEYERARAAMIGAVNKEHFPGSSNTEAAGAASDRPSTGPSSPDQSAGGAARGRVHGPAWNPPAGGAASKAVPPMPPMPPAGAFPGDVPLPELPPLPPPPPSHQAPPTSWDSRPDG
jgi:hypothetical protein